MLIKWPIPPVDIKLIVYVIPFLDGTKHNRTAQWMKVMLTFIKMANFSMPYCRKSHLRVNSAFEKVHLCQTYACTHESPRKVLMSCHNGIFYTLVIWISPMEETLFYHTLSNPKFSLHSWTHLMASRASLRKSLTKNWLKIDPSIMKLISWMKSTF